MVEVDEGFGGMVCERVNPEQIHLQHENGSKEMSAYKSDSDQLVQGVDPIELIKSSQAARAKTIERRGLMVIRIAFAGLILMLALSMAGVVEISKFGRPRLPDTSFKQRVCLVWQNFFLASLLMGVPVGLRLKLSNFLSDKARTPYKMIGVIGLGILFYTASDLFLRPYSGANLDVDWHFIGGWFLVLWGIVFRK